MARQHRYEEIMKAHESEMYRMELEAQKDLKESNGLKDSAETPVRNTKDSYSSFTVAGNKFLKNNSVPSKDPESYSMSNASKSSSKHSKSVTSSHSRPKSGKMVPKINPTTASKIVNPSSTPQNASNMGIPNTISVQIEQKKKQAGIEIEEEMKKVQLELLEKRQER